MATTKEYSMGACKVYFKDTYLGYTSGGVTLTASIDTQEIEVDQVADPIDTVITKRTITVSVPLVGFNKDNLALAFPGSEVVTSGDDSKLVITSASGTSLTDYAGILVLHPADFADDDISMDATFPVAAPTGSDIEISYTKDGLKTIPITFQAYYDEDSGSVGTFGDTTITASA